MRHVMPFAILAAVVALAGGAHADDARAHVQGRVKDTTTGKPVEGAFVLVAGSGGLDQTLTTDRAGRYAASLRPGTYYVVFVYGASRTSGRITVEAGRGVTFDGQVDATSGEVIVIREKVAPPVPPKPTNFKPHKAPPYSDRAVLSDAWTKAWMLLDVSAEGNVTRFKFLKRPGYDLEQIAAKEVFQLHFEPARDLTNKPIRAWVVWSIEWPSAWWLSKFVGTRAGMPPIVGFPPRRMDAYIPCAGSGPWHMGSLHKTYKDCSKPDLSKAATEVWVDP